jgi:hypothetical protein
MKETFWVYIMVPIVLEIPNDCRMSDEKIEAAYEQSWREPLIEQIEDANYDIEEVVVAWK